MACSITITSVTGLTPTAATSPTAIQVTGTASGCASGLIGVTVTCGDLLTTSVRVDPDGMWTAIFSPVPATCQYGQTVRVEVSCDGEPTCVQVVEDSLQRTQAAPPPCQAEVSLSVSVDGCVGTGNVATATFTLTMVPPFAGCTYTWHFDDGSPPVTTTVPTVTHVYTVSGTFVARVTLDCPLPEGGMCFSEARTQFTVPPCDVCPTVTGLTATVSGCAGPGVSSVTFVGTLTPALPGCSFLWAFGDNTTLVTTTPTVTHTYTMPGTYAVAVTAICPNIPPCATTTIAVKVPRCCPVVTDVLPNVEDNECADGVGVLATVILSAVTDPTPAAGTYTWDFGDGSPLAPNPGPNATHDYAAPGSYTITVVYVPNPATFPNCPPFTFTKSGIDVPACGPGGPGGGDDGDGDEGGGCFAVRAIMVIAAILAVVCLLLATCVPAAAYVLLWLAFGFAILALVLGVFWAWLCPKPCAWGLLFAWQVALGTGFVALYFTLCCPWLWGVGLPLVALGVTLALWWKSRCDKTNCELLKELVVALSGVVLPLLGWLGVIPGLAACINPVVSGVLSTLAAAVAVAVAACVPSVLAPSRARRK
jgi:PKD domain-containing protein